MTIRNKLLIGSLTISLGIIALFISITFHSAIDFHHERVPKLLAEHNQRLIEMLPVRPSLGQILQMLPHHETRNDTLSVIDTQGNQLDTRNHNNLPPGTASPLLIDSELLLSNDRGHTHVSDAVYLWATTPVPDTPFLIVNIHRSMPAGLPDLMKFIGVPMAFASLVSVWLSVWGALIIATLLQKLDVRRAQLEHQAHHDPLTDLPNRDAMSRAIDTSIQQQSEHGGSLAVCMLDLHQFKEINDSLGHHCGDELLKQVAGRLGAVISSPDLVGRFYGNKFAVMLNGTDEATTDKITATLLGALENAFEVEGHSLYIRATLGIALYPEHATNATALLQKAEAAIFQAREDSQLVATFHAQDTEAGAERLGLTNDLRNALRDGALELYYQPKVDLRHHHISGAEALARWTHPEHGFIPPDRFIDIAERTGLINMLTQWVLETAIHQCAECHANGHPLKISANLSAINLHDDALVPLIANLLKQHQLPAQYLVVEVTETAMMTDPVYAKRQLEKLDALGVCISIDDFGTAYSSLTQLKQLPVDEIKIDKSFVMDMNRNEDDAAIVRATIGLAHDLGLEVVAEGVEDESIMMRLQRMGCDIVQGYHIARPLPASDFTALLKNMAEEEDAQDHSQRGNG